MLFASYFEIIYNAFASLLASLNSDIQNRVQGRGRVDVNYDAFRRLLEIDEILKGLIL